MTCLESKDYQQIRNSLILMTKLIPHYPRVHHLSMALEKRVTNLYEEEKEKRQDLYALAVGYVEGCVWVWVWVGVGVGLGVVCGGGWQG